jgi:hypothetical protein
MKEISTLIERMATENSAWGYTRIQGALKNLGHNVARSTVAKVLKDHGIPPAPDRPSSWRRSGGHLEMTGTGALTRLDRPACRVQSAAPQCLQWRASASCPYLAHDGQCWVETAWLAWLSSTDTMPVGTAMML